MKTFNSQRLQLSLVSDSDVDFIFEIVNSDKWLKFIGDRQVHSPEDAKSYIDKIRSTLKFYYWIIKKKDSQHSIGIVSLIKRDNLKSFDLGFALLPAYEGQGFASEAAKCVLNFVKNQKEFLPILALVNPENTQSIKLLHRLDFSFKSEIMTEGISHVYEYVGT